MKKLATIASILTVCASSAAMAKTEGNYFGIDLLRSSATHKYKTAGVPTSGYGRFEDEHTGYGLNYKYAINQDNIFYAPGVFYDKIGTMAHDKLGDTAVIKNRYGVKFDVGYDVTDKVAVYFTNGLANVSYASDWSNTNLNGKVKSTMRYFYGAGASLAVSQNVSINAEYNTQNLALATPQDNLNTRTSLKVAKIGVSYHF